jgi:hypothetical protein
MIESKFIGLPKIKYAGNKTMLPAPPKTRFVPNPYHDPQFQQFQPSIYTSALYPCHNGHPASDDTGATEIFSLEICIKHDEFVAICTNRVNNFMQFATLRC